MIGPTTAEMPLKKAVPENAIPAYSGWLPAHSAAAFGHADEKPPLCSRRKPSGWERTGSTAVLTSAPKMTAKKYRKTEVLAKPHRKNALSALPSALIAMMEG